MLKEEKQLLRLKLEFMQYWTCVFMDEPHRAVMNLICERQLKEDEKDDWVHSSHLEKIKGINDILVELQNGFLIQYQEYRTDRQKLFKARANRQFFAYYPKLVELILQRILPQYDKWSKSKAGDKKKMYCEYCKVEKDETELNFIGFKCECAQPKFVPLVVNEELLKRISNIKDILEKFMLKKKKEIDDLEAKISQLKKKLQEEGDKEPMQFDSFCMKYGVEPPKQTVLLVHGGEYEREKALAQFGRKRNIEFVRELVTLRNQRKRREQAMDDQEGSN